MADSSVTPSAVTHVTDWKFNNSYVERLMDHSALTSAHPDDTLILAGPPRYLQDATVGGEFVGKLLPIGMVQQMQVTYQKPTTPVTAIGSTRQFYVSGKATGGANITRLFVNGRNLLRVLYTNAMQQGIDVSKFDDRAAAGKDSKFFINLDSELYLIPFGLAVIFRDKIHDTLGSFYMELCAITAWSLAVTAGQTMIMENVNLLFDRAMPFDASGWGADFSKVNYNPENAGSSKLYKTIFGTTGVNDLPASTAEGEPVIKHGTLF